MTDLSIKSHIDQDPTLDLCPICEHPLSAHNHIGVRWCAPPSWEWDQRECMCIVAWEPHRTLARPGLRSDMAQPRSDPSTSRHGAVDCLKQSRSGPSTKIIGGRVRAKGHTTAAHPRSLGETATSSPLPPASRNQVTSCHPQTDRRSGRHL